MDLVDEHEIADREFQASIHGIDITKHTEAGRRPTGTTTGLLSFRYSDDYQRIMEGAA